METTIILPSKSLTPRRREVLLVGAKLDYSSGIMLRVSEVLGITLKTTESHITRLYAQLEVGDSFSAWYRAYYSQILNLDEVVGETFLDFKGKLERLTPRQRDVFDLYAKRALERREVNRKEMIQELGIAYKTLDSHITNIHEKLGLHNQAQMATAVFAYKSSRSN